MCMVIYMHIYVVSEHVFARLLQHYVALSRLLARKCDFAH